MQKIWNRARAAFRLAHFFFYTLYFVAMLLVLDKTGKLTDDNKLKYRKRWSRHLQWIISFDCSISGKVPEGGPYLYVGNHRSTLDPLLAFYEIEAWPVSRAWVRNWPLVGKGSELTGIIFLNKESRSSRHHAKERILEELQKGNSILIYPEGHTHVEPFTKTFHKGSFEKAAEGGFGVVPFILEYKDTNDYWDHSLNFVQHFLANFGKKRNVIHLSIGEPIYSDNTWTLLRQSQEWINHEMVRVHKDWGNTQYDEIKTEVVSE